MRSLYAQRSPASQPWDDQYASAALVLDAKIAYFENQADYQATLGKDYPRINNADRIKRWLSLGKGYEIASCNGWIAWPFLPFPEIGPRLAKEKTGELFELRDSENGVYCGYIRSTQVRHLPVFDSVRAQFETQVKSIDELVLVRRRRITNLSNLRFTFDFTVGKEVFRYLQSLPLNSPSIPDDCLSDLAHKQLAGYKIDETPISISVENYQKAFNDLFIRRIPPSLSALRVGAEDMAMEDFDLRDASDAGNRQNS